jgi:hypothetical protein
MEDLQALNRRILTQMGAANVNLRTALNLLPVCLGKLRATADDISSMIGKLATIHHENSLDVTSINKEYLLYARQTARDILNGYFDGLIILSIDLSQARILARLSTQQITDLSRRWQGAVFEVAGAVSRPVGPLHAAAVPHYSAAMLAAAA